jgi:hypothetical protein
VASLSAAPGPVPPRRKDYTEAIKVLRQDLVVFQAVNRETFLELTSLMALEDFRFAAGGAGDRCRPSRPPWARPVAAA